MGPVEAKARTSEVLVKLESWRLNSTNMLLFLYTRIRVSSCIDTYIGLQVLNAKEYDIISYIYIYMIYFQDIIYMSNCTMHDKNL